MKTILILALDGVLDSSLTIALDTLRVAHRFHARQSKSGGMKLLVVGHHKRVTTNGGMTLKVDLTFKEVASQSLRPDWVLVPGLLMTSTAEFLARFKNPDAKAAMRMLKDLQPCTQVGATCTGVFLLAEAEVLLDHLVTTTWWLAGLFRSRYPNIRLDETKLLIRDGTLLTAGSAFAQLDLAIAVVANTLGAGIAELCSRYLIIDHRISQAPYMIQSHTQHVDPTVLAAERWIDANLAGPILISDLAHALAMSPKTMARRISAATGSSPVKFIQMRRLMRASQMIKTTSMSIEEVAISVGYQDGTALRKIIKREFGVNPATLRR